MFYFFGDFMEITGTKSNLRFSIFSNMALL